MTPALVTTEAHLRQTRLAYIHYFCEDALKVLSRFPRVSRVSNRCLLKIFFECWRTGA